MKFQSRKFTCGPASLSNALEALGLIRTEDELGKLANTKPEGTNSKGMREAIRACGMDYRTIVERSERNALLALYYAIDNGMPVIVAINNWEHWVTIVGKLGDMYIMVDSGSSDLLHFLTAKELAGVWACNKTYYGIVVMNGATYA